MYCLTKTTLKCKSLVQKICIFLQKETSHCKNSLSLGAQGRKHYIFFTRKMPESLDSMYSSFFMLENIWHHYFNRSGPNSKEIVNFVPILGPQEQKLNWNKFTTSSEFGPLQVKWWYHMFSSIKIEEYMEP